MELIFINIAEECKEFRWHISNVDPKRIFYFEEQ